MSGPLGIWYKRTALGIETFARQTPQEEKSGKYWAVWYRRTVQGQMLTEIRDALGIGKAEIANILRDGPPPRPYYGPTLVELPYPKPLLVWRWQHIP